MVIGRSSPQPRPGARERGRGERTRDICGAGFRVCKYKIL